MGCAALGVGVSVLGGAFFAATDWPIFAAVAVLALALLVLLCVQWLNSVLLLLRFRSRYGRQGKRALIVYSESPLWAERIRSSWLPLVGDDAVVLNRSTSGPHDRLLVGLFKRFCGLWNYSPAIVVFRGLRTPLVFRFYAAFQEAKHGEKLYVELQEAAAFRALGVWQENQRSRNAG